MYGCGFYKPDNIYSILYTLIYLRKALLKCLQMPFVNDYCQCLFLI